MLVPDTKARPWLAGLTTVAEHHSANIKSIKWWVLFLGQSGKSGGKLTRFNCGLADSKGGVCTGIVRIFVDIGRKVWRQHYGTRSNRQRKTQNDHTRTG
jgi:hypothetical protein